MATGKTQQSEDTTAPPALMNPPSSPRSLPII